GLSAWLENFVQAVFLVTERSRMMPCAGQDPLRLVLPRARAPLLQSCVTLQTYLSDLARYGRAMPGQADGAWRIGHDLLQQFGRACQSALSALTQDQLCTAVSKDLLQLLSDPAALATEAGLRQLTGRLIDQVFYRQEQGARMPRDVRELSDIGKVAQLATLSESLSWLVTIAGPLFGDSPVERKVTEQLDHLKVLSGKCFNVIMIEVCLRASNRLKDLPTH
uniref:Stereocilin n=2 Tax=Macrostomum lignano TaxID=282301 RepID=A0A1I8IEQ9_9PLAT